MSFDDIIERVGTHCSKWDMMETYCGVSPEGGLAMWVADMDFRPPAPVISALQKMVDHGVFGYFGDDTAYKASIRWWMKTRHGWDIEDPAAILTTHGLVNGAALCIDTWSKPGDAIVLFTPVYHAFHRIIKAAGREIRQLPMVLDGGRYEFDFTAYEAMMTGTEKVMLFCSPHNPGGRVWTRDELAAVAGFCQRHDLILVSDEIHHDLVFRGHRHIPMTAIPGIEDRLVMMTAPSKTFNIAGSHTGNVIIPDPKLREALAGRMMALGLSPNAFGMNMIPAAYSPDGAAWVDDLMLYLDGNRRLFDAGIAAIPGLRSIPLEATYLAWVDFNALGMPQEEIERRVKDEAKIATNSGPNFGTGGDGFLRFNFATPRARVEEAVERLQKAFADLQ